MTPIDLAITLFTGVLLMPVTVFCIECLLAQLPARPSRVDRRGKRPRAVVLIPAHDEASVIGATVRALGTELGPEDRVVVVADNCTDETKERAEAEGATVFERHDTSLRGKGFAISHGIKSLGSDPPEVVIVLDADCRLGSGSAEALARMARDHGRPAQGENLVTAPKSDPKASVSVLAFLVRNLVRPRGLDRLGLPVHLSGTGMAFPWEVLAKAPETRSWLAEDLLLGHELALLGHAPRFCPEATVRSELPARASAALGQRRRWEHGHLSTIVRQVPRMLVAGLRRMDLPLIALGLDLLVPPLAFLAVLLVAALVGTALWAMAGGSPHPLAMCGIAIASLSLVVFLSWLRFGRALIPVRSFLSIPGYVLWKIPLYLSFLLRRSQRSWERTERPGEDRLR